MFVEILPYDMIVELGKTTPLQDGEEIFRGNDTYWDDRKENFFIKNSLYDRIIEISKKDVEGDYCTLKIAETVIWIPREIAIEEYKSFDDIFKFGERRTLF